MAGNRLGPRSDYRYVDDGLNAYRVTLDDSLAAAAGMIAATDEPRLPSRFKPRGVWVQAADGARKFLVCSPNDSTLYAANAPQSVVIDTESFRTTGRKGERVSF